MEEIWRQTVFVRRFEGWLRIKMSAMDIIAVVWLNFANFGMKIQEFLKAQVPKKRCIEEEKKEEKEKKFPDDFGEMYEDKSLLPKIKGIPVFGTLFDLIQAGGAEQLHLYIDARHNQNGPIFQEHLGISSEAYIFVSSASLMRTVFLYEGQNPRHPLPEAWTLYNKHFNCQRGLFFMDGEEWFHNRRILNRFLLNGNLSWMDDHIKTSTGKLISEWKQQTAKLMKRSVYEVPDLELRLFRWAIDVICTIMFGPIAVSDCSKINEKLQNFSNVVRNVFEKSTPLMNFPAKWAKLLRLRMWREFEENVEKALSLGGEIIDMFVALIGTGTDVVNALVPAVDEAETLFNMLQDAKMPLPMIKRIFVDLVIAAGDTTAYTTIWAFILLAQDNAMQKRVLKDILENSEMSPLVRGLIKETLRLYPVAPFIGRYLATEAVIEHWHLPKDTLVLLSLFTAGRDYRHFRDPYKVKPERWLRDPVTGEFADHMVLQAHGSLPFAIGNRSCIGRKIANKQLHCLLSQVISNFHIGMKNLVAIEPILRMVTVPDQPMILQLRNR